jgi:hypothetical protein
MERLSHTRLVRLIALAVVLLLSFPITVALAQGGWCGST